MKLFKYILSKPLIIFGVMYYIKMGLRYFAELKEVNNRIDSQKELKAVLNVMSQYLDYCKDDGTSYFISIGTVPWLVIE